MEAEVSGRRLAPRAVGLVAVTVVGLGFWGFAVYRPDIPRSEQFYRSLQFFAFESGDLTGSVPWQLETARLAAPALTVASAVVAAALLSRNRLDRWRARHHGGHVVVCGLGERGALAAMALHRAGHDVTAIEIDRSAPGVDHCRRAGVPVVLGDARDPDVLASAGVATAAHLLVLTPSLAVGGEVALSAADLVEPCTDHTLTIHVEVEEPHLAELLRVVELTGHRSTGWRLEELNLSAIGARSMLDEQPAWPAGAASAHVVIVGSSPLALALGSEVSRRWRRECTDRSALRITMLDGDGSTVAGEREASPAVPVTAAYVCLDDETAAIVAALDLIRAIPDVPVAVHVERADALAELLRRDAPMLRPLPLTRRVFTPDVLLDTTVDRIARAIHAEYCRHANAGDPSAVGWDHLADDLKASNRAQAAHLTEKIRRTGRVIVPDDGRPPDPFDDDEIELLGRMEHERWVAERRAAGWRPGPRDSAARTTSYLVPWDELDEDVREVDRRFARLVPDLVADAGLSLRRVAGIAHTSNEPNTRR